MSHDILSRAVVEARKSAGLTHSALAARAGISRNAIRSLERGSGTLALFDQVGSQLDLRLVGLPSGASVGERLRLLRLRKGWSLARLSVESGLPNTTLLRVEKGRARLASAERVISAMTPLGKVRLRKPEVAVWRGGSRDERFTPLSVIRRFEEVVGRFDLDPCSSPNAPFQPPQRYTSEEDGLALPWTASTAFVNPPYSKTALFVRKAAGEHAAGRCSVVVMLLPVRTVGPIFHDVIAPVADVFFLRDRLKFESIDGVLGTFPLGHMVVAFGLTDPQAQAMRTLWRAIRLAPSGAQSSSACSRSVPTETAMDNKPD